MRLMAFRKRICADLNGGRFIMKNKLFRIVSVMLSFIFVGCGNTEGKAYVDSNSNSSYMNFTTSSDSKQAENIPDESYVSQKLSDEPVENSDYSITAENEKYNIADIMKKANSLLEEKSVSYISKNTIKKIENGVISYVENDCMLGEADKGKTHEISLRKMLINHVFEDSRPELKESFFWNGQYYREDINENRDVCFVAERKIYDSVSETETKDESEAAKEWDISYYEEDTTCGTEIFMFGDEEISDYSAFNVTETDDSIILYGNVKGNHFSRNRFDSYMELVFSKDDYSILEIKRKYQIDEETSVDHTIHFICYSDESLVDIGQDLKDAAKECR